MAHGITTAASFTSSAEQSLSKGKDTTVPELTNVNRGIRSQIREEDGYRPH